MKIEILGTGCPKCEKLYENAQAAVDKAGGENEITKVTDLKEISGYGVMLTPALVIDGKVRSAGKIPSVDEIASWLS
jgi:small redox-active disulfide protein 2